MKQTLILLSTLAALVACQEDDVETTCSVENPTEELTWLNDFIAQRVKAPDENTRYEHIVQATYEGNTVFLYINCDPSANTVVPVFNCDGEQIGFLGNQEEGVDPAILDSAVTLWRSEDSECQPL